MAQQLRPLQLPLSTSWQTTLAAWQFIRPHFFMALFFTVVMLATSLLLNLIAVIGSALDGFVTVLLMGGFARCCQHWDLRKKVEIEDLFVAFFDSNVFSRLWPLALFVAASNFLTTQTLPLAPWSVALIPQIALQILDIAVIVSIGAVMLGLAAPLQAAKQSFQMIVSNWKVSLIAVAIMITLSVLSVGTFGLGFIWYLPVLVTSNYIWSLVLFRQTDLATYLKTKSDLSSARSSEIPVTQP